MVVHQLQVHMVRQRISGSLPELHAMVKNMKTFRAYLPSSAYRKYSCVHCRAHLASHDDLISKVYVIMMQNLFNILNLLQE